MRDRRDKEVEVVKREAGGKGLLVCLSTRRVDRVVCRTALRAVKRAARGNV